MNTIYTIAPYKFHGQWVFDDPAVGLVREAFVAGADVLLDKMAEASGLDGEFTLLFSAEFFPHAWRLEWTRSEGGGNWYHSPDFCMECWLCSALGKYFKEAPQHLYVKLVE